MKSKLQFLCLVKYFILRYFFVKVMFENGDNLDNGTGKTISSRKLVKPNPNCDSYVQHFVSELRSWKTTLSAT